MGGGPFGGAGAVFEGDAEGGDGVAYFVGDGEVFVFASGGAEVDDEGHESGEEVVARPLKRARRVEEDAEDVREFFECGEEGGKGGEGCGVGFVGGFEPVVVCEFVGDGGELEEFADGAAGVEVIIHGGDEFFANAGG